MTEYLNVLGLYVYEYRRTNTLGTWGVCVCFHVPVCVATQTRASNCFYFILCWRCCRISVLLSCVSSRGWRWGRGEPWNSGSVFRNSAKMSLMSTQVSCTLNWNLNPKNVELRDARREFEATLFGNPCCESYKVLKPLSSSLSAARGLYLLFWRKDLYVIVASSAFQKAEFSANLRGVSVRGNPPSTYTHTYACYGFCGWTDERCFVSAFE